MNDITFKISSFITSFTLDRSYGIYNVLGHNDSTRFAARFHPSTFRIFRSITSFVHSGRNFSLKRLESNQSMTCSIILKLITSMKYIRCQSPKYQNGF